MLAAWKGIPFAVKAAAACALLVVLSYQGGRMHGRALERVEARLQAAQETARILRKRGEIDDEVSADNAAALCADYGLPDAEQSECVRRLLEADADAGDVGLHHAP